MKRTKRTSTVLIKKEDLLDENQPINSVKENIISEVKRYFRIKYPEESSQQINILTTLGTKKLFEIGPHNSNEVSENEENNQYLDFQEVPSIESTLSNESENTSPNYIRETPSTIENHEFMEERTPDSNKTDTFKEKKEDDRHGIILESTKGSLRLVKRISDLDFASQNQRDLYNKHLASTVLSLTKKISQQQIEDKIQKDTKNVAIDERTNDFFAVLKFFENRCFNIQ